VLTAAVITGQQSSLKFVCNILTEHVGTRVNRRRRRARRRRLLLALTCTALFRRLRRWNPRSMHSLNASTSSRLNASVSDHFSGLKGKGKGSPHSITECRVPELIPVLGSQPAGEVSHKPGGRLPILFTRPAVTPATLKRVATSFAAR